ncbi:O-methyltransferase [Lachnellula subtilissima]|uniref:O-methyltransferase n=1 Tax=Lachnellula subtilissima TaxID=602034 RepID=A0A8H8RPX5_9HELO|nr:O-methyltransferase [Lachnellula subtilissima]
MGARKYWVDWYPVRNQTLDNVSLGSKSPVIVDVGAGKGHDLTAFSAKFPGHKLVLQDLQSVIDNALDLDRSIETMALQMSQNLLRPEVCHEIWLLSAPPRNDYPGNRASEFHAMLDLAMMALI